MLWELCKREIQLKGAEMLSRNKKVTTQFRIISLLSLLSLWRA